MNRRDFLKGLGVLGALFLGLPKIKLPKSARAEQKVGKVLFVNSDVRIGNDRNDGLTPQTAKRTILAAVLAAMPGDAIFVFPGDYREPAPVKVECKEFYMHDSRLTVDRGDSCILFPRPDKTHLEVTGCYFDVLDPTGWAVVKMGEAVG